MENKEKVRTTRIKFYQLENGSCIPLSDIRFTRFQEQSYIDKKPKYDVVLKSGPQFVITKSDFDQINEIIKYEQEEVYGVPFLPRFDVSIIEDLDRTMMLGLGKTVVKLLEDKDVEESSDRDTHTESEPDTQFRHRSDWL